MSNDHELITEHQELQKLLSEQPEAVELTRVQQLVTRVRDAGATVSDPRQREQLRAILRHWGAFVHDRTGEYPPTQLAPYAGEREMGGTSRLAELLDSTLASAGTSGRALWVLVGIVALLLVITVLAFWRDWIQPFGPAPAATQTAMAEAAQTATALAEAATASETPTATPSPGGNATIILHNNSGVTVFYAYVSPCTDPTWGDNDLGSATVPNGGTFTFSVPAGCYDLKAEVSDHTVIETDRGVNVSGTYDWYVEGSGHPPPITPTSTRTPTPTPTFGPSPTPNPEAIQPGTIESVAVLTRLVGHEGPVLQVAFSPDGRLLASAGADGTVRIWSAADGSLLTTLSAHTGWAQAVAFSPDGRWLASGGNDATVRLWDTTNFQLFAQFTAPEVQAQSAYVLAVAFSSDSRLLAAASGDGTVRLWDVGTGVALTTATGSGAVYDLAFDWDGTRLATVNVEGAAQVWDVASGSEVCRLETAAPLSAAFSPDGRAFAIGNTAGQVLFADAQTCRVTRTLVGDVEDINTLAYSADGRLLFTGGTSAMVRIWPITSTAPVAVTLSGLAESVLAVALSPDSTRLASASVDGVITLWGVGR